MSDLLLNRVLRALERAEGLSEMNNLERAGHRAALTRLHQDLVDAKRDDLIGIIEDLLGDVPRKTQRTTRRVTIEDIEKRAHDYLDKSNQERGAFKSTVTRLLNRARESGEKTAVKRLTAVQKNIADAENAETMKQIQALVNQRKSRKSD